MSVEQAERVLKSSFDWSDEDWSFQWAIDLWYQAMCVLMSDRCPA